MNLANTTATGIVSESVTYPDVGLKRFLSPGFLPYDPLL